MNSKVVEICKVGKYLRVEINTKFLTPNVKTRLESKYETISTLDNGDKVFVSHKKNSGDPNEKANLEREILNLMVLDLHEHLSHIQEKFQNLADLVAVGILK